MNVLSCFDGMSCGQLALERAGIPVHKYWSSEIDQNAMKVTKKNFPNTIQMGNICNIMEFNSPIDLIMGGSPCQGFSFAGKNLNFDDPRSKLFFEFVRLKDQIKPQWFLLENVRMKKESQDIISDYLGVEPIEINSSLVSAQNRRRLYWTNIPIYNLPKDKDIKLLDILESDVPGIYNVGIEVSKLYNGGNQLNGTYKSQSNTIHNLLGKFGTLCAGSHGWSFGCIPVPDGKDYDSPVFHTTTNKWRKLTPLECERLQTVPDHYTDVAGVSNTQRYKMLGNGWTIDIISHILKGIKTSDILMNYGA